jgi:signal transduction histidine kinase
MRPLDSMRSIKLKLGVVIVAAVATTVAVNETGVALDISFKVRAAIAVGIALLLVQLLARGMTSPLRAMAAAAAAMARGDYSRRVRATSNDEVGKLADAFNAMATDLAALDQMRRDLVANVSHELRTPISALQATLENLIDGVQQAEPDVLRVMLRQVERLGRLVSQLLELSQLESGAVPMQVRRFELRSLVADAVEEAMLHAPETTIELAVDENLHVDGDPERIHQVMANLLANATRHSPDGAPVGVRAWADDGRVVIEVADQGPGIPPEQAQRVFERFYRADSARATTDGGAGLGLAIARWIVDLHGGVIRPEPNQPHGCRMVVVLPGSAP